MLLPGPNAFRATRISSVKEVFQSLVEGIQGKQVKTTSPQSSRKGGQALPFAFA